VTVTVYNTANPFIPGVAYTLTFGLYQQADTKLIQVAPTLAIGDFLWAKDDGAPVATTNAAVHDGNGKCHIVLTIAETTGVTRDGTLIAHDVGGAQWCDSEWVITVNSPVSVGTSDLAAGAQMDLVNAPNGVALAAISANVWTYVTRTLTAFSPALLASIAAAVWSYTYRTLTMSLASLLTALKGTDIAVDRGDTMILNITNLGDLTGYTELWFTIKDDKDKTDPQSIIQVLLSAPVLATDGLQAIAGSAPTAAANGSITVTNLVLGNVTIRTEAVETAKLLDCGGFYYDFQKATATDVLTLRTGRATVRGDVTRSI